MVFVVCGSAFKVAGTTAAAAADEGGMGGFLKAGSDSRGLQEAAKGLSFCDSPPAAQQEQQQTVAANDAQSLIGTAATGQLAAAAAKKWEATDCLTAPPLPAAADVATDAALPSEVDDSSVPFLTPK